MVGISEGALKGDNPHEKSKECFRKGFSISLGKNKSEADPLGLVGISEGALKGDNPHEKSKECFRKGFSISLGNKQV